LHKMETNQRGREDKVQKGERLDSGKREAWGSCPSLKTYMTLRAHPISERKMSSKKRVEPKRTPEL